MLDPRSREGGHDAVTLLFLRRYPEAVTAADRGLTLEPTTDLFQIKAMIYLAQGDLAQARAVVRGALKQVEPATLVALFGWTGTSTGCSRSRSNSCCSGSRRARTTTTAPPGASFWPRPMRSGVTWRARGSTPTRPGSPLRSSSGAAPQDAQLHALYGVALAYLGRKAEAVREGERAVALAPLAEHASNRAYVRHQLVRIYLLVVNRRRRSTSSSRCSRSPTISRPAGSRSTRHSLHSVAIRVSSGCRGK